MESENIPPAPHPSQVDFSQGQEVADEEREHVIINIDDESVKNCVTAMSDAEEELEIAEPNVEAATPATRSSKRSRKSNLKMTNKDRSCTDTSIVWTRARPKGAHEVRPQTF